ncbi:hypothetical protein B4U80_13715 [Leptotrombidium deliense]|uniref:Uncharacterized protein n=1 Tax=Leptotrombidium deliense TaxID=299467 RepID=A0A443SJ19_9ACAR|nr:hypothetical protein B4U80_13715 [Leptotrombidium deliense]
MSPRNVSSNKVIAKNCIRLNSKWMEQIYDKIRNKSISSLFIPGTHNAASYYEGYKETNILRTAIDNYAICQDENIS